MDISNSSSQWEADESVSQVIEREIQTRMHQHTPPIEVSAQGSTVTLTGHVANQATKEALIDLARSTAGVMNVTDNLEIGGGHPFLDWIFPGRDPNRDLGDVDRGERR